MAPAVFLDRDGVVNRPAAEGEYILRWEDFSILPGVAEGVARLNRAGYRVIVVTNQRCIAKGLITATEVEAMHRQMSGALQRAGAKIDAIYYCPHELDPVCRCRKPAPGMLLDAALEHRIDLAASWMIGDSEIDIAAGRNAGCKTVRLVSGDEDRATAAPTETVAASLADAVNKILGHDKRSDSATALTTSLSARRPEVLES